MENKGYAIQRFGTVCDIDHERGYVRVEFTEDAITSHWLPVLVPSARDNKYFAMPAINEQVYCLLDENCEEGAVIGSLYSDVDKPEGFGESVSGVVFSDGSSVKFDTETGTLTVSTTGAVVVESAESVSIQTETATVEVAEKVSIRTATDDLKSILVALVDAMVLETHVSAAPGSPTGPPLNAAQYIAIKTRLQALLS